MYMATQKTWNIPNGKKVTVNPRTDKAMAIIKRQIMIYKTLYGKLKIERIP